MTAQKNNDFALAQQTIALGASMESLLKEVLYIRQAVDSLRKDFISREEYEKDLTQRFNLLKDCSDRIQRLDDEKIWKDHFKAIVAMGSGIIAAVVWYLTSHIKFFQ